MRILVAVALVLLIGVLDVSVAKRPKVPTGSVVLRNIRRFTNVGNLKGQTATVTRQRRDTSESVEDSELQAECNRNGGPEAYSNAGTNITAAIERFVAIMNDIEFDAKLEEASTTNDFLPIVTIVCSKIGDFQNLVVDVAEIAKPCFSDVGKLALDVMKNMTIGFFAALCQDHGQELATFLNTGGVECITDKNDDLGKCLDSIVDDSSEEVSVSLNETEPKSDHCHELSIARNCIKKEFDSCHKPENTAYVLRLFDSLFEPVCGIPTVDTTTATSV